MFRGTVSGSEDELTQLAVIIMTLGRRVLSRGQGWGTQKDTEVSVQLVSCQALPADGDGGTRKATAARKRFSRFPSFYLAQGPVTV